MVDMGRETARVPIIMKQQANNLPQIVIGMRSPYPIDVMVVTDHQNEAGMEVKPQSGSLHSRQYITVDPTHTWKEMRGQMSLRV